MKKLITSLLTILTITAPVALNVVACSSEDSDKEQQYNILLAINKATYNLTVDLENPIANIKLQITPDFIKRQLSKELQKYFNDKLLSINDITINDKPLNPKDLDTIGTVPTLLSFQYGQFNAQTKLILQVQDLHKDQVIKSINNLQCQYINDTASSLQDLHIAINNNFIQDKLDAKTKLWFKTQEFSITKFIKDGHEINSQDLLIQGTYYITVNFKYYETESSFILKMILNSTINNQVVNAIVNTVYAKTITSNTKVSTLKAAITQEFIKGKLTEPYKKHFTKEWKLINLLNSDKSELKDNDLLIPSNLDVTIEFTYADIPASTTLELNIVTSHNNMVEAIENLNIKIFWLMFGLSNDQAAKHFNAQYIKSLLPLDMKQQFQADKYKFISWNAQGLTDKVYYKWNITFSYDNQTGIIPIILATDIFSRFLTENNWAQLTIKVNSTVDQLTTTFWDSWKQCVLANTNPIYKDDYQFIINLFQIQLLAFATEKGSITNQDLTKKGTIEIQIALSINDNPAPYPFKLIIN